MKNKITIISSIIVSIFIIILVCICTGCTDSNNFINESIVSSNISTTVTTLKTIGAGTTTLTLENNSITSDKKIETTRIESAITTTMTNSSAVSKNSSTTFTSEIITTVVKNNDEIALEVIRGKWGVGLERKKLLEKAGYDYDTIQCIVNNILGKSTTVATTEISNISTTVTETTIIAKKTTINTTETISISTETNSSSITTITEDEYILLCKLVANEYGGMNDVTERAKIVAAIMNQVERSGDSIETCIYRSCVPWGFNPNKEYYCGIYYGDMADAVEYYITNGTSGFYNSGYWVDGADSWWGDGKYNHFYRA